MRHYELVTILSPMLSQDQAIEAWGQISAFITNRNGEIFQEQTWGTRRLAYPIHRGTHHFLEGNYRLTRFSTERPFNQALETFLRLDERVLRSLVVSIPEPGILPDPVTAAPAAPAATPAATAEATAPAAETAAETPEAETAPAAEATADSETPTADAATTAEAPDAAVDSADTPVDPIEAADAAEPIAEAEPPAPDTPTAEPEVLDAVEAEAADAIAGEAPAAEESAPAEDQSPA